MPQFDAPDIPDLAVLLDQQHGLASVRQLRQAGVAPGLAKGRVAAGRWKRPHRGVYAAFSGPLDRTALISAAILRCGAGAVASHETAAELDGLGEQTDDRIHVAVEAHRRVRGEPDGIRVHYAHRLPRTRHPAKAPPRTRLEETVLDLVDLSTTARQAAGWIVAAIQQRKSIPNRLAAALARRKKISWRPMTESILLDAADGAHSMLEVEHLRRVERAHRLPRATRQRRVAGRRVIWIDVDYDEFATRVELDGRVGHEGDGAFRDRRRDNRGVVDGRATLRYGHAEVFGSPCAVAAEQAAVLQNGGWAGQPDPCGPDCQIAVLMAGLRVEHPAA
jgi:hypothetical protein